MTITLGMRVRDRFTGYEGYAVARMEHLHGVPEVRVEALLDGAIHVEWIDEARLVPADAGVPAGFLDSTRDA